MNMLLNMGSNTLISLMGRNGAEAGSFSLQILQRLHDLKGNDVPLNHCRARLVAKSESINDSFFNFTGSCTYFL